MKGSAVFIINCYGANGLYNCGNAYPNWRHVRAFLRRKANWVERVEIVKYANFNAWKASR